jgi:hypothetical protein
MQYPRGIAHATRIQGHIDDLWLHVGRLPGVGIVQEKRTPTIRARPAPIPLLTVRRQARPDDLGPLTGWTMQHWGHHGTPTQSWWRSSSRRGYQINSSETSSLCAWLVVSAQRFIPSASHLATHCIDVTIMLKFEQNPDLPHMQATADCLGCSCAVAV